jgi:heme/copper-type cytochrome/quinol oxidase subunit 4
MTQEEAKTSPFRMAVNRMGRFVKRHAITFVAGALTGVGVTLVAQSVQQAEATVEPVTSVAVEEVTFQ